MLAICMAKDKHLPLFQDGITSSEECCCRSLNMLCFGLFGKIISLFLELKAKNKRRKLLINLLGNWA